METVHISHVDGEVSHQRIPDTKEAPPHLESGRSMPSRMTTVGWKICQIFGFGRSTSSAHTADKKPSRAINSKRSKFGDFARFGKRKDEAKNNISATPILPSDMQARRLTANDLMPHNMDTNIDREAMAAQFRPLRSSSGQSGRLHIHEPIPDLRYLQNRETNDGDGRGSSIGLDALAQARVDLQGAARTAAERHHKSWVGRSRFEGAVEQVDYKVEMMATAAASPERKWNAKKIASLKRQAQASIEEIEYHEQQWFKIFEEYQEQQETLQRLLMQFCDLLQTAHGTKGTKLVPTAHTPSFQPLPEVATGYDVSSDASSKNKGVENDANTKVDNSE